MRVELRAVIDTNVLISAALLPESMPARLVRLVLQRGCLVFSRQTFAELESRLWRPKFDRYIGVEERALLLHDLDAAAQWVDISPGERVSRDASDDMFVWTASAASADLLISGDRDLLDLKTAGSAPIVNPAAAWSIVQSWSPV